MNEKDAAMRPLYVTLGLAATLTTIIFAIVVTTYAIWRLWEWLSPSNSTDQGFEVIVIPRQIPSRGAATRI